jgi:hypothetical protein
MKGRVGVPMQTEAPRKVRNLYFKIAIPGKGTQPTQDSARAAVRAPR